MGERFNENEWIRVILLYLIPILSWVLYTYQNGPIAFSWVVFASGLALLFFGSALMISLLKMKENAPVQAVTPIKIVEPIQVVDTEKEALLAELQATVHATNVTLQQKEEELSFLGNENQEIKSKLHALLEEQGAREEEARRKIEILESETNQHQLASKAFENQIHDLRYEIKTLLQLTEVDYLTNNEKEEQKTEAVHEPTFYPKSSRGLLTRCIDIAQKITAGYHSVSKNITHDPYAFDLRRLRDALRHETGALIVVYSPKEEQLLFANNETKKLFNLSPEHFVQDFSEFAAPSLQKWKNASIQLLTKPDISLLLDFHTKDEEVISLNALLGVIPTGVFRSLIIGVLEPVF